MAAVIALAMTLVSAFARAPIALSAMAAVLLIGLQVFLFLLGRRRILNGLGCTITALAVACFLATMAEEFFLGGTPINGKVASGQYFVGSHGSYSRVSKETYYVAMWPELGMIVLWPTMFVFAALVEAKDRKGQSVGPAPDA